MHNSAGSYSVSTSFSRWSALILLNKKPFVAFTLYQVSQLNFFLWEDKNQEFHNPLQGNNFILLYILIVVITGQEYL